MTKRAMTHPIADTASRRWSLAIFAAGCLLACVSSKSSAQLPSTEISIPPTILIPNYDRVLIGQREGLEAGAFVARTGDAAASWYNPAGLVLSEKSAINASAVAYEWTTLSVEGLGEKTTRSKFSSVNTLVAGVLGAPIIDSDSWRLGFSATYPEYWTPGTLEGAFDDPSGSGEEGFSYLSEVSFSSFWPALSAGYAVSPGLRLGASAALARTSLDESQEVGARFVAADSSMARLRSFRASGTASEMLFSGGMQWDFLPDWTLGALLSSPGVRVRGKSLIIYEASSAGSPGNADLYFRDEEADFEYKHPLRLAAGIGHNFSDRASIEANVRYHAAQDFYSMYSSDVQGQRVVSIPDTPPIVEAVTFADVRHRTRAVWNFAAGGRYQFTRLWTGHAGFYTDASPIKEEDEEVSIFRKADIVGLTGGATLSGEHLSGSLGLAFSFGDTGDVPVGTLADGTPAMSKSTIRVFSLSYAVSYVF
jgi:long-subunit fatty acid transport protein